MIVNVKNVFVGSVEDVNEKVIEQLQIEKIIICGKGLYPYYNEFKDFVYGDCWFFPIEDVKNDDNMAFFDNITNLLYKAFDIDTDYEGRILFCCGAGLSRSPFFASRFLYEKDTRKSVKDYYYEFKEQNKAIKSVFIE